jgi:hypothetical protein
MRTSLPPRCILAGAVILLAVAGCAGKVADPNSAAIGGDGSSAPPPATSIVPDTPRTLVDAFSQAVNHRNPGQYAQLFTDDYKFVFAVTDSAGSAFRDRSLTREEELESAVHLFVTGVPDHPPASRIVLTLSRTFVPEPDSRPGKTFPWHQELSLTYVLAVDNAQEAFRMTGVMRLFIVRGDSAAISPDLVAQGFHPDASRWWIERWEDESVGGSASPMALSGGTADAPTPVKETTWGDLKWLYLGAP